MLAHQSPFHSPQFIWSEFVARHASAPYQSQPSRSIGCPSIEWNQTYTLLWNWRMPASGRWFMLIPRSI